MHFRCVFNKCCTSDSIKNHVGGNMQLIPLGIQFLIIFVLLPDLFFIHKDISAFKKIKEQYTDKIEYRKYLKSVILRNTVFLLFVISISVLLSFVSAFLYLERSRFKSAQNFGN